MQTFTQADLCDTIYSTCYNVAKEYWLLFVLLGKVCATQKQGAYSLFSKMLWLILVSRQAHIPRLKSKNGVISGKIPTVENFATKNSAEKQKMPKEKRAIGKRLSANALFFGFVFNSFYVVFQPVFFLSCLSGQVLGVCLAARA